MPNSGNPSRRVATSSAILVAESALRIGLTALISFWMARQLGPQGFGVLNAAMAATWILIVMASLGLDVPAVLRLARADNHDGSDDERARLLATVLMLRALAALPAVAAAVALAWLLHGNDRTALAVSLIVTLAIVGYVPSVLDVWFRSRTQAAPLAAARLSATGVSSAVKLAILFNGGDLVALAWAVVLEAVLYSAILCALLWRSADRPRGPWRVDAGMARALLRQSAPVLVAASIAMVYMKSDLLLISALTDHTQTGLYALAQKLSEVLYIVPVVIIDSLYPMLAARAAPQAQLATTTPEPLLFDLAAAAAMAVVVLGLLVATPLVRWVFGEAYAPSLALFAVHAWTCVAVALDTARQRWLVAAGLQRCTPWLAGSGALLAIGLNLALLPSFGAMGAACAALVASVVAAIGSSFFFPQTRAVGWVQCRALWPWFRLWRLARGAASDTRIAAATSPP